MKDNTEKKKNPIIAFFTGRKFKYGSYATLFTAIFVVATVVINIIVGLLSDRFILKADLTPTKLYEISQETKDFIKTIQNDIEIIVLSSEDEFLSYYGGAYNADVMFPQAKEMIKNISMLSPKISLKYLDIEKNPVFASDYPNEELSPGQVIVRQKNNPKVRYRILSINDFFNVEQDYYGGYTITSSKVENTFNEAILSVESGEKPLVVMLTGHSEDSSETLEILLSRNYYEIKTQNILTSDIDPNAKFVVISAPQRDYSKVEIDKLEKFLDNNEKLGRHLFVAMDPSVDQLPNLESFLYNWGIRFERGLAVETSNEKLVNIGSLLNVCEYYESDFTQSSKQAGLTAFIPPFKPITLGATPSGIKTEAVLGISETGVMRPFDAKEDWVPSKDDKKGPFIAMATSTRTISSNTPDGLPLTLKSSIVVLGDISFMDAGLFSISSISNQDITLNVFNKLSERKSTFSIISKQVENKTLNISEQQFLWLAVVFIGLVPLAALIIGLVIWLRRRHL